MHLINRYYHDEKEAMRRCILDEKRLMLIEGLNGIALSGVKSAYHHLTTDRHIFYL